MKIFIILFFSISVCFASDEYKSFLNYDHNDLNLIRTLIFDSKRISNLEEHSIDENYKASVYKEDNRLIIAFSGSGSIQFENNYGLDNGIRKFAEKIYLNSYSGEVIVSGDFYCSNLSLWFAQSHLSFSNPHQHKIVLFGTPTFSDTSIYRKIMEKSIYKNDIIIFDYYMFIPRDVSEYPGLLIEITPRNYISDLFRDSLVTFYSTVRLLSLNFGSYFFYSLVKSLIHQSHGNSINSVEDDFLNNNHINYYYFIGVLGSTIFYNIASQKINKRFVPSEESIQESFLRFKESYQYGYSSLENLGVLSQLQALRL